MAREADKAWPQPLTFAGVAAFAEAPRGRLWIFQVAVAIAAAAAVVFFFESAWVPVISRTIADLPPKGAIEDGKLNWPRSQPVSTAGSTFLGISVDPSNSLEASEGADVQVELRPTEMRIRSLFGYIAAPYPAGYQIALNHTELEPWWGAWRPPITAALCLGTIAGLFLAWTLFGWIYAWPVRLIAFYADRDLSWAGAWRVAAAALLPGAAFLVAAILAYTFHQINLVQLLAAGVLHFMIGLVYVLFAPFCLPRPASPAPSAHRNPFKQPPAKRSNPFTKPDKE